MKMVQNRTAAAAGLTALAVLGMTGCSSDSGTEATSETSATTTSASATADPAANLVGTGCAGYAEEVPDGAGSVAGMALDPVATAASNNPLLTTLTQAVSGQLNPGVNLVDTLNGGEFTVIAPTNDAFAKIDPATLETLKTDAPLLTSILTYHVIPGQLTPDQIAGLQPTVQGAEVNITGSGEALKFDDDTSSLVCGGVQTANAVVYMVDTVMMPPEGGPAPAEGGAAPAPGAGGAGTGPGGATATAPGAGAGAGPGGATAQVPGAGAGAGPGGATAQVPGAGAGAGPGGAGVQVPGAGAGAGPGGAEACAGGVCVGTG